MTKGNGTLKTYRSAVSATVMVVVLSFIGAQVHCQECIDRAHFNYNCWQLSMYCNRPQADGIRRSCPVTCGTCGGASGQLARSQSVDSRPESLKPESPVGEVEVHAPPHTLPHLTTTIEREGPQYPAQPPTTQPVAEGRDMKIPPPVHSLESPTRFKGSVEPVRGETAPQMRDVTDSEAHQKIKSCCSTKGLSKDCLSMCSYSTTKSEILSKAIAGSCTLDDARIWVQCAADGRENSDCCRNYGIYGCDNICNGQIGSDFGQLLTCVDNYLEPILNCHRNGLSQNPR